MDNIEIYKLLAKRNGWDFSVSDGRPYFMKNGEYAVPNESTSDEDKELLAQIISEGSTEMVKLILICWNNNIGISGPCSGIKEFHEKNPHSLHFAFIAPEELIIKLNQNVKNIFPSFNHLCRKQNNIVRYDISYPLNDKVLTKEQSDNIFKIISEQLSLVLEEEKKYNR